MRGIDVIRPNRREMVMGLIYLPLHLFLMPYILAYGFYFLGIPLTLISLNVAYQLVAFLYLALALAPFLKRSLDRFIAYGARNIRTLLIGFGIRYGLVVVLAIVLVFLSPELSNPNNDAVLEMVDINFSASFAMTVLLAPLVEEVLFRGLIFAPIVRRSRVWGYVASCLLFAFLHVADSMIFDYSPTLFITMLVYLPPGFALCWAYEKSGSIWTSILLHALLNLSALLMS